MEFNTLTHRIAEGSASRRRRRWRSRWARRFPLPLVGRQDHEEAGTQRRRHESRHATLPTWRGTGNPAPPTPPSPIATRPQRKPPFDRTKYETVTTTAALAEWIAAAHEAGPRRLRHRDHRARSHAGRSRRLLARDRARQRLLRAARPSRGRVRSVRRRRPRARSDPAARCACNLEAPARRRDRAQDRPEPQVRHAVMARHGIAIAPFDDTMLLSYALDGGRGGHGMDDFAERHLAPRLHPVRPGDRARAPAPRNPTKPSPACRSRRPPSTLPRTPTSRCGCGCA